MICEIQVHQGRLCDFVCGAYWYSLVGAPSSTLMPAASRAFRNSASFSFTTASVGRGQPLQRQQLFDTVGAATTELTSNCRCLGVTYRQERAASVWAGTSFKCTAAFIGVGKSSFFLYWDGITKATLYLHMHLRG